MVEMEIINEPSKEDLNHAAIIIGLGRIYDVLLTILAETSDLGQELSNSLQEMHKDGRMFFPTPSLRSDYDKFESD